MRTSTGARVVLLVFAAAFFAVGLFGALSIYVDEKSDRPERRVYDGDEFGVAGAQFAVGPLDLESREDRGLPRDVAFVMVGTGFIGMAVLLVGYFLLMELQGQGGPLPERVPRARRSRGGSGGDDWSGPMQSPGHDLRIGRYDSWS